MSATGRNGDRLGGPLDDYETPAWCVHRLLEMLPGPSGVWVDPCAGRGAIIEAAALSPKVTQWEACEIDPNFRAPLTERLGREPYVGDFLALTRVVPEAVHVISNPPYNLAAPIIQHARVIFPRAIVTMLLRINFLATDERYEFMSTNVPDIYVLPNRPSFRKRGTDSTEYAWFSWSPGPSTVGRLCILGLTPKSVRCPRVVKVVDGPLQA